MHIDKYTYTCVHKEREGEMDRQTDVLVRQDIMWSCSIRAHNFFCSQTCPPFQKDSTNYCCAQSLVPVLRNTTYNIVRQNGMTLDSCRFDSAWMGYKSLKLIELNWESANDKSRSQKHAPQHTCIYSLCQVRLRNL